MCGQTIQIWKVSRVEDRFLKLLANEAPVSEFGQVVADVAVTGTSPEEIQRVESGYHLALQVRGMLEARQQREMELTALIDTARDLAAVRDLDFLLHDIVRRARRLLSVDLAYLSLVNAERTETSFRVTDGSISPRFQRLRLPFGAGLGGLVAQSGSPHWTTNYFTDQQIKHVGDIDAAVAEEGAVSILGVPLSSGDEVIGVLFAANRVERPFSQNEVALLSSLAIHATIAIENTRLLEDTRKTVTELHAAQRVIEEHSGAIERAAAAHERLLDVVLNGGDLHEVAYGLVEVLGGAVAVLDDTGSVIACVGDLPHDDAELRRLAMRRGGSSESLRIGDHAIHTCPVVAAQEQFALLVSVRDQPFDEADQRIVERGAVVAALVFLFQRSVSEAESRVRGEVLCDLLEGRAAERASLAQREQVLGVDLDQPYAVLVATAESASRRPLERAVAGIAERQKGLSADYFGLCVVLLPSTDVRTLSHSVGEQLNRELGCPVTVAGAGPGRGSDGVPEQFQYAKRSLEAMRSLGRVGEAACSDDLGFIGLLLSPNHDTGWFVDHTIGPLLRYDRERGTALRSTVEAYFASDRNLAATAKALHVHVNTVTQRLDRVGRLLGSDWKSPERALQVQLALQVSRLRPES